MMKDIHARPRWPLPLAQPRHGVIMVVEDELLIRLNAVCLLEEAGFSVIDAATGDRAMEALSGRDDVAGVFTDVEMPGTIDGLGLATAIRARWPWIKLALTSGRTFVAQSDMPAGAVFVPKPYQSSDIVEIFRDDDQEEPNPRPRGPLR